MTYEPEISGWPGGAPRPDPSRTAALLGGSLAHPNVGGRSVVVDREYAADWQHGRRMVAEAAADCRERRHAIGVLKRAWPGRHQSDSMTAPLGVRERLLFVDVETTGLSGGAGIHVFLLGCGYFEGDTFRTRQVFLPSFSDEHRLLAETRELVERAGAIVTYNGRTFDVPVMETRYLFHRLDSPFEELLHVDMLHPARRLWKRRSAGSPCSWDPVGQGGVARAFRPAMPAGPEGPAYLPADLGSPKGLPDGLRHRESCSLPALEQAVLGFRRVDDVPGFEIPGRYFQYIRTGNPEPLEPVFEHNRLDLLSLAVLTTIVLTLLDEGPEAATDARECLELGLLFERARCGSQALACYRRAAEMAGPGEDLERAEALTAQATRMRRERRYAEAAECWEKVLDIRSCSPALARRALHALAVHHEHRSRDLRRAKTCAVRNLVTACDVRLRAQAAHRVARLDDKIGKGDRDLI